MMPSKYLTRALERRKRKQEKLSAFIVNLSDMLPKRGGLREGQAYMQALEVLHSSKTNTRGECAYIRSRQKVKQ